MSDELEFGTVKSLDEKVAIVTGAGRGIGRAEALLLAAYGARVVVNNLGGSLHGQRDDQGPAHGVVEEIRSAGGEAIVNTADVGEWDEARQLVAQMARRADDFENDSSIDIVNPDDDMSVEALAVWIAELERDDDWVDPPTTAALLIAEVRTEPACERSRSRRVCGLRDRRSHLPRSKPLALAPRDRTWWVPDHFHVEAAAALRPMLLQGLIDDRRAGSALERLLALRSDCTW